jgi:hypothetical protein
MQTLGAARRIFDNRSMPPAPQLQIVLGSPLCSVGTYAEVIIVAVHSEMTAESLRASVTANRKLANMYPHGVASLALAHFGAKMPSSEMRAAAAQAMADTRMTTRCAAQVIAGEGFWPSAVRSVITAMEKLRPDDKPRRSFGSLAEAVPWLCNQLDRDPKWGTGLVEAAQQLLNTQVQTETVTERSGT